MIVDRIGNSALYAGISNGIGRGLQFLETLPAVDFLDQRIEIAGESVFARFQRYTTTPPDGRFFEAHRRYIDIQYIAAGSEKILVTDLDGLTEHTPYDRDRDVAFYEQTSGTELLLRTGDFAILFPHDAHLPMIPADDPAQVRKVVVKVAV